jgi:opacity protein-like surface antigen
MLSALGGASAQEAKTPSDWGFEVTPYVWGAGIGGNITTAKGRSASFSQSFSDILKNLNAGLMLLGEVRYQRWYLLADFDYMKLTTDAARSVPILGQPSLEVKSYLGTLDGGYRFIDSDSFKLDGLVGVRVISMDNTLNFSLVPRSPSVGATWADPLIGVRAILPIGSSFFANAYGDVGGGPDSDLTWQVYGGLGYSFNQSISAYAGYRYLSIKHDVSNLTFDMDMQGPLIGVGFRF